ncbi:MAG: metal-dependent hydrolase [Anaerolineae bacterium]
MFGMDIAPWTIVGILAYSIVVTLFTSWIAAGFRRPQLPSVFTLRFLVGLMAGLMWTGLLYVFGVLAIRYVERMPNTAIGYMLLGSAGFMLSWARAALYQRVQKQRKPPESFEVGALALLLLRSANYLLLALAVYLLLSWLLRLPLEPLLLIPLWIGALLPDLDRRDSLLGRLVPWISQRLENRLGYLEEWHTPAAAVLVAIVSVLLGLVFGMQTAYLLPLGFVSHLLIDMLAPRGIMLLWPFSRRRYGVLRGILRTPGSFAHYVLAGSLVLVAVILWLAIGLRPEPAPAPTPSYGQTLERYYSMRGKTQVFAYLEGSWQISGRPISGWFEILNAADDSYLLLDRYTREIFTAGRTADDNVYATRIVLRAGSPVVVKPVEIHLKEQRLSEALDIVYEMQLEPGLKYIYVSGELLLAGSQDTGAGLLWEDLSQTSLRKVRRDDEIRYSLHYLDAAELIGLAEIRVQTAELVIVATYVPAQAGPTATPLPSPPATREPTQ